MVDAVLVLLKYHIKPRSHPNHPNNGMRAGSCPVFLAVTQQISVSLAIGFFCDALKKQDSAVIDGRRLGSTSQLLSNTAQISLLTDRQRCR